MKPGNEPPQPSRDNAGSVESEIRRFDGVLGKPEIDHIVREEPLEIRVNSEAFATLMRTPGDDRDLALGFLYAEGVIDSRSRLCLTAERAPISARCRFMERMPLSAPRTARKRNRTIRS